MTRSTIRGVPCVASVLALLCGSAMAAPTVHIETGVLTGKASEGMDEFLGIRYAAPPVGALRWTPTRPLPAALATHEATAFGPHCAQLASPYGIASSSEDCLYLNVFTPPGVRAGETLPVMVWIHGGALVLGESDDYDPEPLLATQRVIVVTMNYRLGYLGYLAETGLDAEPHLKANYGLMDQQAALGWVKRNIASFGGNPHNVTLFGESAGGLSTLSNLISPAVAGLFSQALVESGSYSVQLPSLAQSEVSGDEIAAGIGCAPTDTACLRAAPVSKILGQETNSALTLTTIVDGVLLPQSINTALKSGSFNRVPLFNGTNHDEFRQFLATEGMLTAQQYPEVLADMFGTALAAEIALLYPPAHYEKPVVALAAALTDYSFSCPAQLIDQWASAYVPVYAYEFNDLNAPEDFLPYAGYNYGASHASELQFLFEVPKIAGTRPLNASERSLSGVMRQYWTDFAVRKTPNGGSAPAWAAYATARDDIQSFQPPSAHQETNFTAEHHCKFWDLVINP